MGAGGCDDGLSGSMVGVDGGRGRKGLCGGERDDERGGGGVVFGWEDGGRGTVPSAAALAARRCLYSRQHPGQRHSMSTSPSAARSRDKRQPE